MFGESLRRSKDHGDLQLSHYPPQGIIESFTEEAFVFYLMLNNLFLV